MTDFNETIPPRQARKSGVHQRILDHVASKAGGWKAWLLAIVGGGLIAAAGVGSLLFVDKVPWWASFIFGGIGVQIATRGAFGEALVAFKDVAVDLMKAKKDAT